ncbi:helicase-related protein [Gordonia sihwensis]|uniref:helicase-related protein n=1 Tax=Gordonia sihwensis TaxID=173559 RepID=UPI003D98320B
MLAGLWTRWMHAASTNAETSAMASTPLRPYAHQTTAVYGAMLPQPMLRMLLADEPGTGKTIMAGLYVREMQRLGLIRRAIIVCPANLATKWVADFEALLGGGLRHLTADTIAQGALETSDLWVVSLELAAVNPAVQEAIRPDHAGWDLVVFDEAHRLTPSASSFHHVGRLLAHNTPRALLMTATPHRGSEWLFRHLLHLVDPAIYPDPGMDRKVDLPTLRPGPTHFLRRMKEDLVDYDGKTKLFKGRTAENRRIPLSETEYGYYTEALDMVDQYFPPIAQQLARMVYGKRAASSLHALAETLRRRMVSMGVMSSTEAAMRADPAGVGDESAVDEAEVIVADSTSARAEKSKIRGLLDRIDQTLADPHNTPSKWGKLTGDCLAGNGITPGSREQAVVFTEYADTAEWLAQRLIADGYSARVYSGRQHRRERDQVRADFMRGQFQIIVTTDAGNEGIDLQAAHVLVNYDIPWSLVRLEQRMGRIHRVGQTRDVRLYNLVATDTREGQTLMRLLDHFVNAALELRGQMFDSLTAVAEISGVRYEEWLQAMYGDDEDRKQRAIAAAEAVETRELVQKARVVLDSERRLATQVNAVAALTLLQRDLFSRINPAIVAAYLQRLADANVLGVAPTIAGDGFRQITSLTGALPDSLGGAATAHIATSGDALRAAQHHIDTTGIIALGPGEPGFTDLIAAADDALAEAIFQSGAADDPSSITPYDLYVFEATMTESAGHRTSVWASLIKVDDSGAARAIRWEALANLVPSTRPGTGEHPARLANARAAADQIAADTVERHRKVRADWFAGASRDLQDLPVTLTESVPDHAERVALRRQLRAKTEQRLAGLEALTAVELDAPVLVSRIRVHPTAAEVPDPDSETVSMTLVAELLTAEGWHVDDIHTECRGYDLEARRGSERRCVEVKGVAGSAASNGVRLSGNEVLIATQYRGDYWLYVVDNCADGHGTLFGIYSDPATLFSNDMIGDAIFRVPGSVLANSVGAL